MREEGNTRVVLGVATGFVAGLLIMYKMKSGARPGLRKVSSPSPSWKPGEKQSMPFAKKKMIEIDPKTIKSNYPLVISSYVSRL